jgi:hypothetical protein
MSADFIHIDAVLVMRTTPKALLCRRDGEEFWVPKGQLPPHLSTEPQRGRRHADSAALVGRKDGAVR